MSVYKPIHSLDCASDLSPDKTLFIYSLITWGWDRSTKDSNFEPFIWDKVCSFIVLKAWCSYKSSPILSNLTLCFNELDFIPNLIKSETMNGLFVCLLAFRNWGKVWGRALKSKIIIKYTRTSTSELILYVCEVWRCLDWYGSNLKIESF